MFFILWYFWTVNLCYSVFRIITLSKKLKTHIWRTKSGFSSVCNSYICEAFCATRIFMKAEGWLWHKNMLKHCTIFFLNILQSSCNSCQLTYDMWPASSDSALAMSKHLLGLYSMSLKDQTQNTVRFYFNCIPSSIRWEMNLRLKGKKVQGRPAERLKKVYRRSNRRLHQEVRVEEF